MSIVHDTITNLTKFEPKELRKVMIDSYGMDEDKISYILNHLEPIIESDKDICERVFVYSLDKPSRNILHRKYFGVEQVNKCNGRSIDTNSTLNSLLYYDGIEELYNRMRQSISVSLEEVVYILSLSMQTGYMDKYSDKIRFEYKDSRK